MDYEGTRQHPHSSGTSHQQQWIAGRVSIHLKETAALFLIVTVGAGRRAVAHCHRDGGQWGESCRCWSM